VKNFVAGFYVGTRMPGQKWLVQLQDPMGLNRIRQLEKMFEG
jgi:hypothetical protein